ncbi:MAG: DUF3604 domain-containing protein, partial [Gammaproteobacteria bacterium]
YPGASQFGAYGGLTCFLMESLDRDAIFDCLQRRHHYATTGDRIHIDLGVSAASDFDRFDRDPMVYDALSTPAAELKMGEIAITHENRVSLKLSVMARAPIERIDVLNAMDEVATLCNPANIEDSNRLRVLWRDGQGSRCARELAGPSALRQLQDPANPGDQRLESGPGADARQ